MWRDRRRLAAFLLLFGSIFGYEIHRLFFVQHGTPRVLPVRGHTTLVDDIGGRREVVQTFRLDADGFDAITVQARPGRQRPRGDVVFELYDVVSGRDRLIYRLTHPAEKVAAERSFRLGFPSIVPSRGRYFRLRVRAPTTPAEHAIALVANLTDDYDAGQLSVDGRERWGDLVFETSARYASTWWLVDQIMPVGPWWLRTWWFASALFLFWNAVLAYVCFLAIAPPNGVRRSKASHLHLDRADTRTKETAATRPSDVSGGEYPRTKPLGWFAALLMALVATAAWPNASEKVIDLLDRFPEARKETELDGLHSAFDLISVTILGERKPVLLELPPSAATWRLRIPPEATFAADIGLAPHTWTQPTDGVVFFVEIIDQGKRRELARWELAPFIVPEQRRWFPVRLDLRRWAGRTVDFVLRTDPGRARNPVNDACVWGAPRIVAPRAPRAGATQGVWPRRLRYDRASHQ
ncbi:MAG: hypothetical protein ACRD2X_13655 [Vicinamibacteraceae bacterium]